MIAVHRTCPDRRSESVGLVGKSGFADNFRVLGLRFWALNYLYVRALGNASAKMICTINNLKRVYLAGGFKDSDV